MTRTTFRPYAQTVPPLPATDYVSARLVGNARLKGRSGDFCARLVGNGRLHGH
jgi:hypothetical protein